MEVVRDTFYERTGDNPERAQALSAHALRRWQIRRTSRQRCPSRGPAEQRGTFQAVLSMSGAA
jgi:hypothetical protein